MTSTTNMIIRAATPADAEDLVRLINGLADYERLRHESKPDVHVLRAQLAEHADPRIEALMAEVDGCAVGFALYYPSYSTFLTNFGIHLEDLFVEPSFRGRGIGKALLMSLVDLAARKGCQRLEWNVLDWNEPAIAFYEKLGAKPLDDWTTMRLDADAIMSLSSGDDGTGAVHGFIGAGSRGGAL